MASARFILPAIDVDGLGTVPKYWDTDGVERTSGQYVTVPDDFDLPVTGTYWAGRIDGTQDAIDAIESNADAIVFDSSIIDLDVVEDAINDLSDGVGFGYQASLDDVVPPEPEREA